MVEWVTSPQHLTVPALVSAHVWYWPAATATAFVIPTTSTGVKYFVVVDPSFPIRPWSFGPQHFTPPATTAQVCVGPSAIDVDDVTFNTLTGVAVLRDINAAASGGAGQR